MNVNEALDKLREFKRQFCEIEVGETRGEHLYAVWHSKVWPRATEGALYLPAPANPDIPPMMGNVNLIDDLSQAPAHHHKSGREEEFSEVMVPAVTAIRKLFREAGRVILRMPQLQAVVSPIACGGRRSAIHVELEIWWFAALFRECSEPIQEHDYNDGGPEFETNLSCNVLTASDIVCDRFIELLSSEHGTPVMDSPTSNAASATVMTLSLRFEKAYQSYKWAERQIAETAAEKPSDPQVWDFIREHGFDGYDLPDLETWARYLREGREFYNDQKNTPRGGREGGSIVRASETNAPRQPK